jgi:hypothetical protein
MQNYLTETVKIEQLRELNSRIDTMQRDVENLSRITTSTSASEVIPALVNFADDTDFIYSDKTYNVNSTTYLTYTDDENVLANWYGRTQATALVPWIENTTGLESTESIRASSHGSGVRTGFQWNKSEGTLILTGGYRVGTRLHLKSANAGNYFAARLQISRVLGKAAPTESVKLKVSLWDNTDNIILRGTYPPLTSTKIGHTGAGDETVTRQYILEVQMPDGRKFYSNTASFSTGANQVVNSVPVTSVNSTKFVNVSWPSVVGSSRYRVYRRTPSESDTNWYLVGTVTNGGTQTSDFGGTGAGVWTVPSFDTDHLEFQIAEAYYDDVGELLQTEDEIQEISVGLRIPFNFVPKGNQFLQLEFVKEDYTASTTTEVAADSIRIDRVGLCYTNGQWCPSSRDVAVGAGLVVNPPPSGGGGDIINPPSGGGHDHCVEESTLILVWSDDLNHYYVKAKELAYGDKLVTWDYEKKQFAPSKITKVINGISMTNHVLNTQEYELVCSFSHRLITHWNDFLVGTPAKNLGEKTITLVDNELIEADILGHEILKMTLNVITFRLKPHRNYIANGFLCHNYKPPPTGPEE